MSWVHFTLTNSILSSKSFSKENATATALLYGIDSLENEQFQMEGKDLSEYYKITLFEGQTWSAVCSLMSPSLNDKGFHVKLHVYAIRKHICSVFNITCKIIILIIILIILY